MSYESTPYSEDARYDYVELLLEQAMKYWQNGDACPMHIASRLMCEGLDVQWLELKHRA